MNCYIGDHVRIHTDIYRVSFTRFSTLVFMDSDPKPDYEYAANVPCETRRWRRDALE